MAAVGSPELLCGLAGSHKGIKTVLEDRMEGEAGKTREAQLGSASRGPVTNILSAAVQCSVFLWGSLTYEHTQA